MSTRAIEPSTLKFAKTLVRIKARQLGRVIPDAAVNSQQDLEQELLLEVVIRWPGFDPNRGNAEAFVESVVRTKLCKMLRDAKRAKRMSGPTVSIDGNDAVAPDDGSRVLCIRMDVETVIGKLSAGNCRVCDQLLRESVSEAARQLRTPRSTLEYAVNSLRERFEKADVDQYFS